MWCPGAEMPRVRLILNQRHGLVPAARTRMWLAPVVPAGGACFAKCSQFPQHEPGGDPRRPSPHRLALPRSPRRPAARIRTRPPTRAVSRLPLPVVDLASIRRRKCTPHSTDSETTRIGSGDRRLEPGRAGLPTARTRRRPALAGRSQSSRKNLSNTPPLRAVAVPKRVPVNRAPRHRARMSNQCGSSGPRVLMHHRTARTGDFGERPAACPRPRGA